MAVSLSGAQLATQQKCMHALLPHELHTCALGLLQGCLLRFSFLQTGADKLVFPVTKGLTVLKTVQSMVQLFDVVLCVPPTRGGGGEVRGR